MILDTAYLETIHFVSSHSVEANVDNESLVENVIYLPPKYPECLEVQLTVSLNDTLLDKVDHNLSSILHKSLAKGLQFWTDMQFDVTLSDCLQTLSIKLRCMIWNESKVFSLLEKPLKSRAEHFDSHFSVVHLKKITVTSNFYVVDTLIVDDMIDHLNEFLTSLIISQLEFRFPLVFNFHARNSLVGQEDYFGPISFALNNSSSLIPLMVKMVADDTTNTTVYKLLTFNSKSKSIIKPKFHIFKKDDN